MNVAPPRVAGERSGRACTYFTPVSESGRREKGRENINAIETAKICALRTWTWCGCHLGSGLWNQCNRGTRGMSEDEERSTRNGGLGGRSKKQSLLHKAVRGKMTERYWRWFWCSWSRSLWLLRCGSFLIVIAALAAVRTAKPCGIPAIRLVAAVRHGHVQWERSYLR